MGFSERIDTILNGTEQASLADSKSLTALAAVTRYERRRYVGWKKQLSTLG